MYYPILQLHLAWCSYDSLPQPSAEEHRQVWDQASHADESHQTDDNHPVVARVVPNQDPELGL